MLRHRVIGVLCIAVCLLPLGVSAQQAATPSKAAGIGTAIGEGISAAIDTAFPGVTKIIDLIWPNRNGRESTESKKKGDALKAASSLPSDPKVKDGLSTLDAISTGLETASVFLSHCVIAENNVVSMQELLQGKNWPLAPGDKLRLDNYWTEASGRIRQLSSAAASLPKLGNPNMQTVFQAVADANIGKLAQIDNTLKSPDKSAKALLEGQLSKLDGQLSAANALSGEILVNVAFGLKQARNKAAGAQAAMPSAAQRTALRDFDRVLVARYAALQ